MKTVRSRCPSVTCGCVLLQLTKNSYKQTGSYSNVLFLKLPPRRVPGTNWYIYIYDYICAYVYTTGQKLFCMQQRKYRSSVHMHTLSRVVTDHIAGLPIPLRFSLSATLWNLSRSGNLKPGLDWLALSHVPKPGHRCHCQIIHKLLIPVAEGHRRSLRSPKQRVTHSQSIGIPVCIIAYQCSMHHIYPYLLWHRAPF